MSAASVSLQIDGVSVTALPGETIWELAARHGQRLPHLCHRPAEAGAHPGQPPAGNCRACLVEIEGERTLAASCCRQVQPGMVVHTQSVRAQRARRGVLELLAAEAPPAARESAEPNELAYWLAQTEADPVRYRPSAPVPERDASHPAIRVDLAACIRCTRCVRACRDIQGNDVIGLAGRGAEAHIVFDDEQPLGRSSCVGCGECVEACPTGALRPARAAAAEIPLRAVDTVCPYCGVGCQLRLHVDHEDRLSHVTGRDGPANRGRLCVKGRYGFDYAQHPSRLTRPLIRLDGVGKSVEDIERFHRGEIQLADRFREASWDEALDRAAQGFAALRRPVGEPSRLAGFGSAKGSNEEAYLFQKLIRLGFGTHNVDHCTRLCHASSVAALLEGIGSGAVSNPVGDVAETDLIFLIGANPSVNHPVAASWIKNAVRRGAQLILADPRETPLARHASVFLRFQPDSDVALLSALLHVILAEGLADRHFLEARVEGLEALAASVAEASPERMAPICGIPAETLREVARRYARAERAMILWGMGIAQHVHGTDNARCLIALALLTGQIGRPGTGLHPLRGQNNVQGASDAGLIPMMLPGYRRVAEVEARAAFAQLWGEPIERLPSQPGLTVVEITEAMAAGRIEGLYIMGENPAMSDPDLAHTRAALAKLKHLVVQDIFPTETALLADVILPASAHAEKWGSTTNTDRLIQLGRPAWPPPGEARQDLWLIEQIGRRLGLSWQYWRAEDGDGHRAAMAPVTRVYEEMRAAMPALAAVSWERLLREGAVQTPASAQAPEGQRVLFGERFATRDGRARLIPVRYQPGPEQASPEYPFILTTGRLLEHWHTGAMTRRSAVLNALAPTARVSMHPEDAAALGLEEASTIRIQSRHGTIEACLHRSSEVQRGQLFIPFAYWEAAANRLTGASLDPVGKIPGFKVTAVRVTTLASSC